MRTLRRFVLIAASVAGCAAPLSSVPGPVPTPAVQAQVTPHLQPVRHEEPAVLPQPATAAVPAITLDQAINACLVADPKLRAGFEVINQANADALTASLTPNPDLFVDGQLLPLTRPFSVDRPGGPPQQDVQLTYGIDWFLFGKRAAAMASAGLGVRVSESGYADLVRQRVTETAVAYYDVVEAKALVDLAKQDVENLQKVETLIATSIQAGVQAKVDLSRIRLDLLNSRRMLRDAEATLVANKAKLRAKMGRADADPAFDVVGTPEGALPAMPPSVDDAYALALRNRPDLEALRWKLAQAQADTETERRKGLPKISPMVGWSKQYQRPLGQSDADTYTLGVTVNLPFCDRNQGNRAKAASNAVQSGYELAAGEVELRAEIETVVNEFRTTKANADAVTQEQLQLAGSVRDSINAAYRAGDKPLLDVLDAQRNYRDTYRLYISSRAGYWRALAKYQSAIGQQVTHHDNDRAAANPGPPR